MAWPLLTLLAGVLRLQRNARVSRARFEAERLRRFRDLARLARAQAPYYARIMQARGIDADSCQPADFPVLTKRMLREHFDDIVTDRRVRREAVVDFLAHSREPRERFMGQFIVLHSSGSSGEVGHFVFSTRDWLHGLAALSRLYPPRLRRTRCAFYGATGGHFGGVSWALTPVPGLGLGLLDVRGFDINAPLAPTLAALDDFQPHIVGGYVSGHKLLAQAQLQGRLHIRPETIVSGAESLSSGEQQWLGEVFGCPCINVYGASETMLMGIARPGDSGMTLFDDELIFEPAADHVLVTVLFNRTMPLIRYRLNDTLRLTDRASAYGHYPVIEPLIGRDEWVPQFRNARGQSDFLSPSAIAEIFVPGIWRYQFRCLDDTAFRFTVCLEAGLDDGQRTRAIEAVTARLRQILDTKGLNNVGFAVELADDIPVNPATRKFQLVLPPQH